MLERVASILELLGVGLPGELGLAAQLAGAGVGLAADVAREAPAGAVTRVRSAEALLLEAARRRARSSTPAGDAFYAGLDGGL